MSGNNVLKFCYTHDIPMHPLDEDVVVVWLGDGNAYEVLKNNVVVVRHIYPDLDFYRPFLLGSAGSFAIKRLLESLGDVPDDCKVCIQSYRKIVTRIPIGVKSSRMPGFRIMAPNERYDTSICMPVDSDYLIPMPINIGRCLAQYASVHNVEDFLRYIALAIELGVLANYEDVEALMMGDILIPCGVELGVVPYQVYMEIVSALERVALEFCRRHQPADLGLYNRRAASFCTERLGSYLLLKHLSQSVDNSTINKSIGYVTHFTTEGDIFPNVS